MRIRKLELQNFKGFSGPHTLDFQEDCKNLLVLGDNGSGKTSIAKALEGLLDASRRDVDFQRNMFCDPSAVGQVRIELSDGSSFVWNEGSRVLDTPTTLLGNASKAKRFLDYKGLLRTYFLQGQQVNLFDLLLEDIIADFPNNQTNNAFSEDWKRLTDRFPLRRRGWRKVEQAHEAVRVFNNASQLQLERITRKANDILKVFDPNLSFDLKFPGLTYIQPENKLGGREVWLEARLR